MAKTQGWLARRLTETGNRLFRQLSRWEERGISPGISRFLKLSFLGLFVSLIGFFAVRPLHAQIRCYVPVDFDFDFECDELLEHIRITDVSATPNPTQGADSITVKAHVEILNSNEFDPFVSARLRLEADTARMRAVDSIFDEQVEDIIGGISVEGLEPGEYWIYASATTSLGYTGTHGIPLIVSEAESKDTTEAKKEE